MSKTPIQTADFGANAGTSEDVRKKMDTPKLFEADQLTVINIGLERFADDVALQGAKSVPVSWKPGAGGDLELLRIIERLREMDES